MKFAISLFSFAVLAMVSCSNDGPTQTITANPYDSSIQGTCTMSERPTWKTVDGTTYSSMCVILDEYSLPTAADSLDIMAAFVGEECRGTATPIKGISGQWRFNLLVSATTADEKASSVEVTFRYYSNKQQGTYTSASIPYQSEAILGSLTESYLPDWQ